MPSQQALGRVELLSGQTGLAGCLLREVLVVAGWIVLCVGLDMYVDVV